MHTIQVHIQRGERGKLVNACSAKDHERILVCVDFCAITVTTLLYEKVFS